MKKHAAFFDLSRLRLPPPEEINELLIEAASRAAEPGSVAEVLGHDLESDITTIVSRFDEVFTNESTVIELRYLLSNIIGRALLFGSLGPMSKAARTAAKKPNIDGGKKGGKKSAQARNRNKERWEALAEPLIIELRNEFPHKSQDGVATEVDARWKEKTPPAPSHGTIKALVSRMEKSGKIKIAKAS